MFTGQNAFTSFLNALLFLFIRISRFSNRVMWCLTVFISGFVYEGDGYVETILLVKVNIIFIY